MKTIPSVPSAQRSSQQAITFAPEMHAYPGAQYMRRIREEFDALLNGTTQVELAELAGVTQPTIGRRFEKDDRFTAWPADEMLAVAYALRARFPGLPAALQRFFNRDDLTKTRSLSAPDRAFEVSAQLLDEAKAVQAVARDKKISRKEARALRQQWTQTTASMLKLLDAIEVDAVAE